MVTADGQIQFTLQPPSPLAAIDVRMRRFGDRWVAQVGGGQPNVGLALTPSAALRAALEPMDQAVVVGLMANLTLLEPSCRIAEIDKDSAG